MKAIVTKRILKTMAILMIVLLIIVSVPLTKGFIIYREAKSEAGIVQTVQTIQANKDYINIGSLSADYIDAVVAVEDHRFFNHGAIDIISIGRAAIKDLKAKKIVEGGSTITQQLAKVLFFKNDQGLLRKVAETFMAFDMERLYSKSELLELYVNTIYFGSGYYGIREAALGYYGKEPVDLTIKEAATLAGIPNAPSIYSLDNNPDLAAQRQKHVLESMARYGYLTHAEAETAS
jgi:membrane peptidoglycan carboxypeptidase